MMALRQSDPQPMTYDDYCLLPDDGKRYQVIEGELFVSPAPRTTHQDVIVTLMALLHTYVKAHDLGKVYVAPTDVLLRQTVSIYGRDGDRFVLKREAIEDNAVASDVVTGFQTSARSIFA